MPDENGNFTAADWEAAGVKLTTRARNVARYADINSASICPPECPAITRIEAERAAYRLCKKFGPERWRATSNKWGRWIGPSQVRRVWLSKAATTRHGKGWRRLAHDVSHRIFRGHYPDRRPHDPLHAHYERQIVAHIVESGWLNGVLLPKTRKPKPTPTKHETRSAELAKIDGAVTRWESKAKRAKNALAKLHAKRKRIERALQKDGAIAP
jgi:hypothetical protein